MAGATEAKPGAGSKRFERRPEPNRTPRVMQRRKFVPGEDAVARNADVAAKLLRDAAQFFLVIGEENPNMLVRMKESAEVYEAVADLVEEDPEGDLEDDED
jgi:hypothetical protein